MNRLEHGTRMLIGCVLFALVSVANCQEYPTRPIRIVVPFAAGSGTDAMARIIGQKMAQSMGQQIIVDNRPGLNGALGTEAAAKAPPDGYTIILGGTGNFAINMVLYTNLAYDTRKDFDPISLFAKVHYFLVVGKGHSVKSIREFVDLAKSNPGKRTMAFASASSQLAAELFRVTTGVDVTMVPYKSLSQELVDLGSGEVDAAFLDASAALPQLQPGGRLMALAVTSPERNALMPGVPTFAESGYPAIASQAWNAFFAPVGTPPTIIAKLDSEIRKAIKTNEVKDKFASLGIDLVSDGTPERLNKLLQSDISQLGKLFSDANLPKN